MTERDCASPIPPATLLEYWLGELDEAQESRLDEHLIGCSHCCASLQSLVDLGGEIRAAMREGAIQVVLPDAFVKQLAGALRLREYRVPHNGSVHCTVAPDDDLLITRLDAPLAGVERLDVERVGEDEGEGFVERLRDVPFNAATGEVILTSRMERIRALPASTLRMRLLAVAPAGERLIGEYTFHHAPYSLGDS